MTKKIKGKNEERWKEIAELEADYCMVVME